MSRHTLQQILQTHGAAFIKEGGLPLHCLKALDKLTVCRTAALGGHAQYCENGHLNGVWYNSCKHRFCPQCRGMATEEWLINTKSVLLDCPHHHVIFTLPSEFNDLWRYNRALMSDILHKAVHKTLRAFYKDSKYLNATPGILSTLHTWGRALPLHPHAHVLISHGGVNDEGEWVVPKKDSLFPQTPVMMVFRGKFIAMVRAALEKEDLRLPEGVRETPFQNMLNKLGRKKWVVHFCKRYDYAEGVAKYLSRYVKSGPLKNGQIVRVTDKEVTFTYKSHQTKKREFLTLSISEFIRRVVQHVPLPGKPAVRYCGLYNSSLRERLNVARAELGQEEVAERTVLKWQAYLEKKGGVPVCEKCQLALTKMESIPPLKRVG